LTTILFFYYSDKNSKRARDLHLLKKLKTFLKEGDYGDEKLVEEVQKTMQELKTNDIRTQAIEMLSTSKYIIPDALSIAVNIVVDKLVEQGKLVLKTECVCEFLCILVLYNHAFICQDSVVCCRGNLPYFGRTFLRLNCISVTRHTCI